LKVRFREQSIKELKAQIKDIEDSFENNELDYGRKLYLIENCIYGVDIQSIATQISKLRFFISLIVDQKIDKTKENFGIRPLPNLETKFVAANTLIGIEKPKAQLNLFENQEIKKLEAELKKVRHKLFSSKSPSTKRKLRDDDKELRNRIADLLVNDGWENKTASQLASWDPYDQNESSPFFDMEWMFDIREGFDVVIGNPPYGAKFTDEEKTLFKKIFKHQDYQPESFLFFTEKSFELLKYGAVLSFIIPNTWLTNLKLIKIRKFLTADNAILNISHYHKSVFDAVVDTEVVIFQKGFVPQNQVNVYIHNNADSVEEIKHNQNNWKGKNGEVINIFTNSRIESLIQNFKKNSYQLSNFTKVVAGFTPYRLGYGNPEQTKEIVEGRVYDSIRKIDSTYKAVLRGKDIDRFVIKWDGNRWIKYGVNLAEPRYTAKFDSEEKIVMRQTGDSLIATLDDSQFVCMKNIHVLHTPKKGVDLKYLVGLINSSLLNFYFQYLNPEIGEALAEVKKETVEKLLIKETSNQEPFISLVDQILTTKKENPKANTTKLERQLDEMVFKLYELTYEEVKVVAPDFWLSEAEYAAVEIE